MSNTVAIYNPGGVEVVGHVSVKHAIKMLYRKVATVLEPIPGQMFGPFELPRAVELVKFVYRKWMYAVSDGPAIYSFENVKMRDAQKCNYCGAKATTVDHIVPKCQGGKSEWLNSTAACSKCNSRKAGRTPDQAGMRLKNKPYVPSKAEVLRAKMNTRM